MTTYVGSSSSSSPPRYYSHLITCGVRVISRRSFASCLDKHGRFQCFFNVVQNEKICGQPIRLDVRVKKFYPNPESADCFPGKPIRRQYFRTAPSLAMYRMSTVFPPSEYLDVLCLVRSAFFHCKKSPLPSLPGTCP